MALQGLFLAALGVLVLLETFSLKEVIFYLALIFILFGGLLFIWGMRSRKNSGNWWGLLFFGLIMATLGALILYYETEATSVFHDIIGIFAALIGLSQIVMGFGRKGKKLMFFANGLVSLVVGFLIIYDPFESVEAVPFLVALFSTILGIFVIYYSVKLRNYAQALALQKKEKNEKADGDKITEENGHRAGEQKEDGDSKEPRS